MSKTRKLSAAIVAILLMGVVRCFASEPPQAVNQILADEGWTEAASALPGERVECRGVFTAEGGREYEIRTCFSQGVEFDSLRAVRADGRVVSASYFTAMTEEGNARILLSACFSEPGLREIEVSYAVRLGDEARCLPEENLCALELKDGSGAVITGECARIRVCSVTVFRGVSVAETGRQNNPLQGVCFSLYRDKNLTKRVAFIHRSGSVYLACSGTGCGHSRHEYLLRTRQDGLLRMEGLKPGIYYLQECVTPQGYQAMASGMELILSPEGEISAGGITAPEGLVDLSEPSSIAPSEEKDPDPLAFYTNGCRVLAEALAVLLLERRRLFR